MQVIHIIHLYISGFRGGKFYEKKKIDNVDIYVLGYYCISSLYLFFLGKKVDSKNYENRNMASRPMLTIDSYKTFPTEFEKYYNDNIPFRNQLIRFNNSIDYFLFKRTGCPVILILSLEPMSVL